MTFFGRRGRWIALGVSLVLILSAVLAFAEEPLIPTAPEAPPVVDPAGPVDPSPAIDAPEASTSLPTETEGEGEAPSLPPDPATGEATDSSQTPEPSPDMTENAPETPESLPGGEEGSLETPEPEPADTEDPATAPPEESPEPTDEAEEPEETPDPEPEETFSFAVSWEYAEEKPLYFGDPITLIAESEQGFTGLRLQWQVAEKPAELLEEGGEEWRNLENGTGERYRFEIQEPMRSWRWRLRLTPEQGEPFYSDEMTLPEVSKKASEAETPEETPVPDPTEEPEASLLPEEGVLGVTEDFPWAEISFTAEVPPEEITLGTEVVLIAEIHNPREGMRTQWQYLVPGEEIWRDVEGAVEPWYPVVMDETNYNWAWRLLITVPVAEDAPETEPIEGEGEEVPQTPAEPEASGAQAAPTEEAVPEPEQAPPASGAGQDPEETEIQEAPLPAGEEDAVL